MSTNNNASYYEQDYQTSIEKVILAEDIKFKTIDDVKGKFYFPVMTPTNDTSSNPNIRSNGPRKTSNYVTLNIPGYMLIQFMMSNIKTIEAVDGKVITMTFDSEEFVIPKGTTFLASFIGGEFFLDKTCIIGLLTSE